MKKLVLLLLLLSPQAYSSSAIIKPFAGRIFDLTGKIAEGFLEEYGKGLYEDMKKDKIVTKTFDEAPSLKRRFVRKFIVSCKGQTTCNVTPHSIVQVSAVDGQWQCCGDTKKCTYKGHDKPPHAEEYRKNTDHNYMALLSDESSSQGTPVVVNYKIPSRKKQLCLWANDSAGKGLGNLQVSFLCEENE